MLNFIIGVICTLIWLQIIKLLKEEGVIIKYLTSPVDNKFSLDWTTRQLLALINKGAAERWYEARIHCHQNIFMSLMTSLHLVWIVRTEMEFINTDNRYYYVCNYFHGFQSYQQILNKCTNSDFLYKIIDNKIFYYYQTLICGHNIVHDFMLSDKH